MILQDAPPPSVGVWPVPDNEPTGLVARHAHQAHYLNLPNRPAVHISSGTLEEREPVTTEEISQVGPSPIGEEYYDFGDPLGLGFDLD